MQAELNREITAVFTDVNEWQTFCVTHPWVFDQQYIDSIIQKAQTDGIETRFSGRILGHEINVHGKNFRESVVARGFSSRLRAMLDQVLIETQNFSSPRILMHEAISPFALALRGRFPYCIGVEFAPNEKSKSEIFPIPHCDIEHSQFPNEVFDIVVSNDVLEHVSNLMAALTDTARILKHGGVFIATFPFLYMNVKTECRSMLINGVVVHLLPPEFHPNPIDPENGSLVFNIPGWDILDDCKRAGFCHSEMRFISSAGGAIVGAEIAGILLLRAVR